MIFCRSLRSLDQSQRLARRLDSVLAVGGCELEQFALTTENTRLLPFSDIARAVADERLAAGGHDDVGELPTDGLAAWVSERLFC
jgi:hypothetical protein